MTTRSKTSKKSDSPELDNSARITTQLDALAQETLASIDTFNLNGDLPGRVKAQAQAVLTEKDVGKKKESAYKLAALLKKGTMAAQALGGKIDDVLQLRLPGIEEDPEPTAAPTDDDIGQSDGDGEAYAEDNGESQNDTEPDAAPEDAVDSGNEPEPETTGEDPYQKAKTRPIRLAEIQTAEPFKSLFPVLPEKVERLARDMKLRGFDNAHPVVIWLETDHMLLDGHTRVLAAKAAGIEEIPAVFQSFGDEDDALDYVVHTQCARRNLTDGNILSLVEQLDKRHPHGGDHRSMGCTTNTPAGATVRTSEQTGKKLGVSSRTVERARQLIDSKNNMLVAAVKAGEMTIYSAIMKLPRKPPKPKKVKQVATQAKRTLDKVVALLEAHGDAFGKIPAKLKAIGVEIIKVIAAAEEP